MTGNGSMRKVIVQLYDEDIESDPFLAETELTEMDLSDLVDEIKNKFMDEEFYDWTYDDLIQELEKRGAIKVVKIEDCYRIYA